MFKKDTLSPQNNIVLPVILLTTITRFKLAFNLISNVFVHASFIHVGFASQLIMF